MLHTREQLFHVWRSFNFDENTETIDSYVMQIRQVATLLGYGEPQVLEVFKNTLPTKLYWILFPLEDLRQAVETAKRKLTKEKLDKLLTGQISTSPFMNIRDGTERTVSFNARDELGRQNRQANSQNRGRLGNRSDSRNRGQFGNNTPRFQQSYRDNNF